jgi:arylsulfatase A-like enzyme
MSTRGGRPNILWLVSEDCPPRFGCYGDPLAHTPNIDRLAQRGVLFEQAFCPVPVCAPTRFSLLTGLAPESHAPAQHMRAEASVPPWTTTYPQALRELGYYCSNNAKTDYNSDVVPDAVWDASSPQAHWRNRPDGSSFLAVFNYDGTHESSVFMPDVRALYGSLQAGGPVPYTVLDHDPPRVDPAAVRLPAYLPDTPEIRQDIAEYYARISEMDAWLGVVLQQLEQDGLTDSTIVIQSSDHGGVNPRSKRYCYDEGLQVPLVVAAPEGFADLFAAPGSRVNAAVSSLSIPPTLIELAGGTAPSYMERSLLRRAAAGIAFGGRGRMDERYDLVRTARDQRYRYLRNYLPHRPNGQYQAFAWQAEGYQSWEREHLAGRLDEVQSAFWRPKPGVELYDLAADPDEVVNLAGDPEHVAVETRLREALHAHMLDAWDNGFLPECSPVEGFDASRAGDAYPLERILDVADAVPEQDPRHLARFLDALADADRTVRRWGSIGVLSLGEDAALARDAVRARLDDEHDPFVVIPAVEWLARHGNGCELVDRLAALAQPQHPRPVRLEALAALLAVGADLARPFEEVVATAADDEDEYVRSAGTHLLAQLRGTYTPELQVFSWSRTSR